MNIAIGAIMHESNTFSPSLTTEDNFRKTEYVTDKEIINLHHGKKSEISGMLDFFDKYDVTVIPTLSAWAMPSGKVTRNTYITLKNKLLSRIEKIVNRIDGVLLALHGSMTVEGLEDPEGDILATIRGILPAGKGLASTLDHHANVTEDMVNHSDFLIGYRTHPHIDQYDVGYTGAGLIMKLIEKRPKIKKSFVKIPLITPGENQSEPIEELHDEIKRIEKDPKVFTCSYFVGYPWADVSRQGASVITATFETDTLADNYSQKLADKMWALRKDFKFPIYSVEDAVEKGMKSPCGPFILDELCDCTLGGASGDVVTTVRYFVENKIDNSVAVGIVDPESVEVCKKAGCGKNRQLNIGGKVCLKDNPSLKIDVMVKGIFDNVSGDSSVHSGYETDMGRIVVVDKNGLEIILIERPGKIGGPSFLERLGINPSQRKFIIVKEGLNPLVEYRGIASDILMIDTPGFDKQNLKSEDYKNVPRPIYPFDPDMTWRAS